MGTYQARNVRGEFVITFPDGCTETYDDVKKVDIDGQFIVVTANTGELVAFSQASIRSISLK
jgi:hypothetical protein